MKFRISAVLVLLYLIAVSAVAAGNSSENTALTARESLNNKPGTASQQVVYYANGLRFVENLVPRKQTSLIVIHHTAIENSDVKFIHALHLKNGWAGIGYHYVIYDDGSVHKGRPEKMVGAHAYGVNDKSVGIALVGNFNNRQPSGEQMSSLIGLVEELTAKYHIAQDHIVPHSRVSKTDCPGTQFPWQKFMAKLNGEVTEDDGRAIGFPFIIP